MIPAMLAGCTAHCRCRQWGEGLCRIVHGLRSARPSGNVEDHIANVLRGFDHFAGCHNIVKLEARSNGRLQRVLGEHTVQIGDTCVASGICQVVDDEPFERCSTRDESLRRDACHGCIRPVDNDGAAWRQDAIVQRGIGGEVEFDDAVGATGVGQLSNPFNDIFRTVVNGLVGTSSTDVRCLLG